MENINQSLPIVVEKMNKEQAIRMLAERYPDLNQSALAKSLQVSKAYICKTLKKQVNTDKTNMNDLFNPNINTEILTVTPLMAQEFLTHNISNRRLSEAYVKYYADQMKKGLWRLTNDAISFSKNGNLLNGQHRLKAVCESGISCQFVILRGLREDAFVVMDNGKIRSSKDALYTYGIANANNVAAIVKRKLVLDKKNNAMGRGYDKILNATIIEEYNKHKVFYDSVCKIANGLYRKLRLLNISTYGSIISYLVLTLGHQLEDAVGFFEEFVCDKAVTNNVVNLLRSQLQADKMSTKVKMTMQKKQGLIILAWNYWISGKSVTTLQYNLMRDSDKWFL